MSRGKTTAIMLGLALVGCGSPEPQVQISTYVGPSHARHDEQQRRHNAQVVARTVWADMMPATPEPSSTDEPEIRDRPVHPPQNAEQFESLVEAVRTAPLDEIDGPARRLAAASPAVWPQIIEGLRADRKGTKGDYRSLLDAIGGDVPNRYGHFARTWKKAHGFTVKLSSDWFSDLLALPTARVSRGLNKVYRDCVLRTALLRAAADIGAKEPAMTAEVVATLLDVAYLFQGTFRDEVGRAVIGVGDEAIPYLLIESMRPPGRRPKRPRENEAWLRAEYARLQLDKMDRLHPHRATSAVREDPRLLTRVLHAYGTARLGEAATVLLEHADVVDPAVRAAARAAFVAYVDGAPPPVRGRTIRLLGGGTGRALSHLSYRQRAGLAIRERMEAEAPDLLEPECEVEREDGSLDRRCQDQPERLTQVYFAWLDEQRTLADQRAIAQALAEPDVHERVEHLDRLLAANPTLIEGRRLIPVYREAADAALATSDSARAGQLLRKAARLAERDDPSEAEALRVQALLAEASVPDLTPQGRHMLLTSAQQIAPEDPRVRTAMATMSRSTPESSVGSRERWTPMAGMVGGLWGLGLMGSWWRRRRRRRS